MVIYINKNRPQTPHPGKPKYPLDPPPPPWKNCFYQHVNSCIEVHVLVYCMHFRCNHMSCIHFTYICNQKLIDASWWAESIFPNSKRGRSWLAPPPPKPTHPSRSAHIVSVITFNSYIDSTKPYNTYRRPHTPWRCSGPRCGRRRQGSGLCWHGASSPAPTPQSGPGPAPAPTDGGCWSLWPRTSRRVSWTWPPRLPQKSPSPAAPGAGSCPPCLFSRDRPQSDPKIEILFPWKNLSICIKIVNTVCYE